jgi:hypothetical protein
MEDEDIKFFNSCFQEHFDMAILNPRFKLILDRNRYQSIHNEDGNINSLFYFIETPEASLLNCF